MNSGSNADRMQRALDLRSKGSDSWNSKPSRLAHSSSLSVLEKPALLSRRSSVAYKANNAYNIHDYSNYRFSAQSNQSSQSRISSVPSTDSSADSRSISSASDSSSYTARVHPGPKRLFESSKNSNEPPAIVLATSSSSHQFDHSGIHKNSRDPLEDLQEEMYIPVSIAADLDIDRVLSSALVSSADSNYSNNSKLANRRTTRPRPNSFQFTGDDQLLSSGFMLPLGDETLQLNDQSPISSNGSEDSPRKMPFQKLGSHVRRFAKKITV